MREMSVDVAIIGAGTAGLNARREAERAGRSWVLIEAGPYGTTCARVGCMPSKLLIAAADAAHAARDARRFGVEVEGVRVDGRAVMDRVRRERDRFVGFVVRDTEALDPERRLRGFARFVGPTTLQVGDEVRVHAKSIVLATGSAPWIPPVLEPVRDRVQLNDHVFDWEDLPDSVVVFGTGIIGLELGQALHRLGVRTVLLNPFDDLGPFTDPEVGRVARRVLGAELDLGLGVEIHEVAAAGEGVRVRWTTADGSERDETFDVVLSAAGRRPSLEGLDLEVAGVPLDDRGRPVSDMRTLQLGDTPIFLAGDAAGHRPLLHEASDEGRIAGANAARFPKVEARIRRTPLAVAFTHPQMALVGLRWADLDPDRTEVGTVSYEDQGRARVMGVNQGLVRIYADRDTCRLVGAELFGPRMEHMAHSLAWVTQRGLHPTDVLSLPFYHPVLEEGLRTALRDLSTRLRIAGRCPPEDCATAPGT
jgi:dihydrolipoamide dehydrogenase